LNGTSEPPFDTELLDRLMDEAGLDVVLITSKHNVQYLLGGYRFFMFDYMDAIGLSRYLPIVVYPKGAPQDAAYIANPNERYEQEARGFWVGNVFAKARGSVDAMALCLDHLRAIGLEKSRIGIEAGFLPADAFAVLSRETEAERVSDCIEVMEALRAVKRADELDLLRSASERIERSMIETFAGIEPGQSKAAIVETLRQREVAYGLTFEYCLITAGRSMNRAPSGQVVRAGDILSLDSGGNLGGYIGDICRMGVLGEPDAELVDLLAEIETVQQAAFAKVRAGALGGDLIAAGEAELARQPNRGCTDFFAHGMGVITHEAPFLMTNHPVAYEGTDAARPLEAGMILSVETTMLHPRRGFIKLEDTLAVTDTGYELFGSTGRGWNRGGTA
jgi:Xaa-Pro dipeptidase